MKILLLADDRESGSTLYEQLQQIDTTYQITVYTDSGLDANWLETPKAKDALFNVAVFNDPALDDVQLVVLHTRHGISPVQFTPIRRATRLPILLVAPVPDEKALIQLYEAGVDDHLIPPVSQPLLAAKLRVWQRWVARLSSIVYH